ncbi:cation:proton antiporter, partial [Mesorhizobium sp. M8A.F.Ca.ET.173.01.1.1]
MSLVYLLSAIVLIMMVLLLTMTKRKFHKFAGPIALIAPIISSIYFLW